MCYLAHLVRFWPEPSSQTLLSWISLWLTLGCWFVDWYWKSLMSLSHIRKWLPRLYLLFWMGWTMLSARLIWRCHWRLRVSGSIRRLWFKIFSMIHPILFSTERRMRLLESLRPISHKRFNFRLVELIILTKSRRRRSPNLTRLTKVELCR